ncbi:hypothetical protein BCR34DRAFT_586811 [Clohesyomyces aquaticus]|uniref:Uncharacterized protein n=1 Tax=Clohesyomyces aquaticus TaxID=1231657 RepID=A0A1Y1ZSB2_9PLEO|nr:hypothetical protein BCR34DRAFT_586811 [Clohesyomyces aquaticus]
MESAPPDKQAISQSFGMSLAKAFAKRQDDGTDGSGQTIVNIITHECLEGDAVRCIIKGVPVSSTIDPDDYVRVGDLDPIIFEAMQCNVAADVDDTGAAASSTVAASSSSTDAASPSLSLASDASSQTSTDDSAAASSTTEAAAASSTQTFLVSTSPVSDNQVAFSTVSAATSASTGPVRRPDSVFAGFRRAQRGAQGSDVRAQTVVIKYGDVPVTTITLTPTVGKTTVAFAQRTSVPMDPKAKRSDVAYLIDVDEDSPYNSHVILPLAPGEVLNPNAMVDIHNVEDFRSAVINGDFNELNQHKRGTHVSVWQAVVTGLLIWIALTFVSWLVYSWVVAFKAKRQKKALEHKENVEARITELSEVSPTEQPQLPPVALEKN